MSIRQGTIVSELDASNQTDGSTCSGRRKQSRFCAKVSDLWDLAFVLHIDQPGIEAAEIICHHWKTEGWSSDTFFITWFGIIVAHILRREHLFEQPKMIVSTVEE
jgi:hypothetical protein